MLGSAISLVTLILCVLVAEATLQFLDRDNPFPNAGWRTHIPPEPVDYTPPEHKNQLGLHGRPIDYDEDDIVVVLLGDSQVAARTQPYWLMPERRLEHYLNVFGEGDRRFRVFSIGAPAWGQDQQLLMLQRYLEEYRADVVLHWITWGNDFYDITFPTRLPVGHVKPTFWLEEGELRGPSFDFDEPVEPVKLWAKLHRVLFGDADERWEALLPPPYAGFEDHDGPADSSWQERLDRGEFRGVFPAGKYAEANSLTPRSARMEYSLALMQALLGEMQSLVKSRGGRFAIFWFEYVRVRIREQETLLAALPTVADRDQSKVYAVDGRFYKTSRHQFERNQADGSRGFRRYELPIELEKWAVSDRDRHLNSAANDLLMKRLARAVLADMGGEHEDPVRAALAPIAQSPFPGMPHALPGRVQLEEFDLGGEGIAYHDLDLGNEGAVYRGEDVDILGSPDGFSVAWVAPGEWLEYRVRVTDAAAHGPLQLQLRAASRSPGGGLVRIRFDGVDHTGPIQVPEVDGGEEGATTDVLIPDVHLEAGEQTLRLEIESGVLELDFLDVLAAE